MTPPAPTRFMLPGSHPAIPGHFPGRPIVPGVLLLDAVLQAIAATQAEGTPVRPPGPLRAKFLAPVAPGMAVEIRLVPREDARIAFTCHCDGIVVLRGET
ncbi:hypothetical protein ACQW02_16075 [Humitalea sp. 24SJ18S-53]|uniref:hypothetical protein n=1 Tax=Humitalea sp. 24SJ18S-53 TaxID=3422307 RepID=UPI003D67E619